MTDDTAQLTESFVAHEHLVPDAADVLARANEIARSYQRRRWAVRATGSAVVGAGLVAGGIALPGWTAHSSEQTVVPSSDPATSAPDNSYTQSQEMTEFFASGYTYQDAQQLAQLWHDDRSINEIKAAAGLKLLEGQTLAIPPSGQPESPVDKAVTAFFAAGYSYGDAQTLAGMWHESVSQAKADAGAKLIAGEALPIQPSGNTAAGGASTPAYANPARVSAMGAKRKAMILRSRSAASGASTPSSDSISVKEEQEFQAFFNAGYNYDDAVKLGNLWHESDITQVKAEAGQKLLDGDSLPVDPSGTPASPENRAVEAFFNAGYTYDDAVTLATMWHETNTYKVKAEAGQKLLDGQTLPIAP